MFSCVIVITMSLPDFDPAIHKETGKVPVVRRILGSQPENDNKKEPWFDLHGRLSALCFRDRVALTGCMTEHVL